MMGIKEEQKKLFSYSVDLGKTAYFEGSFTGEFSPKKVLCKWLNSYGK